MNIKELVAAGRRSMSVKVNSAIAAIGGLFSNFIDMLSLISDCINFVVPAAKAHVFDFQSMIDPETFKSIGTALVAVGLFNLVLQFAISAFRAWRKKKSIPKDPTE